MGVISKAAKMACRDPRQAVQDMQPLFLLGLVFRLSAVLAVGKRADRTLMWWRWAPGPTAAPSMAPGGQTEIHLHLSRPHVMFKSMGIVIILLGIYTLLIVLILATPQHERYPRSFLERIRCSRFFHESLDHMTALSRTTERDGVPAEAGDNGGSKDKKKKKKKQATKVKGRERPEQWTSSTSLVVTSAIKNNFKDIAAGDLAQGVLTERLMLLDLLASRLTASKQRAARVAVTAAVPDSLAVDSSTHSVSTPTSNSTSTTSSTPVTAASIKAPIDNRGSTSMWPASLSLTRPTGRQRVLTVFLHALTLFYLSVTSAFGSLEAKDLGTWQAYRLIPVLMARAITTFIVSSCFRLTFIIMNKDERQEQLLELELVEQDVGYFPIEGLPPMLDSVNMATLRVILVELTLVRHVLAYDLSQSSSLLFPLAIIKSTLRNKVSDGAVSPTKRPPATGAEELHCVQRQLFFGSALLRGQYAQPVTSYLGSPLNPCKLFFMAFWSEYMIQHPLYLFSSAAMASRIMDIWLAHRLGWSPYALLLRLYWALFVARELPADFLYTSAPVRVSLCKLLMTSYIVSLTVHVLLVGRKAKAETVLPTLAGLAAVAVTAAAMWPLVILVRDLFSSFMIKSLKEALVTNGPEFTQHLAQQQKRDEEEAAAKARQREKVEVRENVRTPVATGKEPKKTRQAKGGVAARQQRVAPEEAWKISTRIFSKDGDEEDEEDEDEEEDDEGDKAQEDDDEDGDNEGREKGRPGGWGSSEGEDSDDEDPPIGGSKPPAGGGSPQLSSSKTRMKAEGGSTRSKGVDDEEDTDRALTGRRQPPSPMPPRVVGHATSLEALSSIELNDDDDATAVRDSHRGSKRHGHDEDKTRPSTTTWGQGKGSNGKASSLTPGQGIHRPPSATSSAADMPDRHNKQPSPPPAQGGGGPLAASHHRRHLDQDDDGGDQEGNILGRQRPPMSGSSRPHQERPLSSSHDKKR